MTNTQVQLCTFLIIFDYYYLVFNLILVFSNRDKQKPLLVIWEESISGHISCPWLPETNAM